MADLREETIRHILQLQKEYAEFIDSLSEEEQELIREYGAEVLIIERVDTQPLPVVAPVENVEKALENIYREFTDE